jgi:hypothetical protein
MVRARQSRAARHAKGSGLALALLVCAACRPEAEGGGGTPPADAAAGAPRDAGGVHVDSHRPPADTAATPDAAGEDGPAGDAAPGLSAAELAIAGQLHQAFIDLPCMSEEIELQYCIPRDMGKRSVTLQFGGEPGQRYAVVLGVWGVMETVSYANGSHGGEHFDIGGTAVTPMTAQYGLEIGTVTYHLNQMGVGAGDHYTYGLTYTTPAITITGGARIVLFVRDPDNFVNTNHMDSAVEEPPPALQERVAVIDATVPRHQFVYLEVKSATRLVP